MVQFFHNKTAICSVYSKNLKHYEKRLLQKILFFKGSHSKIFIKKVFLRISWKSQENTCSGAYIWWSCSLPPCNFIDKENPTEVLSVKFYEILRITISWNLLERLLLNLQAKQYICRMTSIATIFLTTLLTLKLIFVCWDNFGNHHPEQILKGNICDGVPL